MKKNNGIYHFLGITILLLYVFLSIGSMETFNAGTAAATPFLQAETERLRQQNDQFLNQVAMNLNVESNNYIRSLNLRTDYRNFSRDWYNLRDRLYNHALQQNNSGYVKRNLPYIFIDNDRRVTGIIGDIAHIKWQEDGSPGQSPSTPYRSLPNL